MVDMVLEFHVKFDCPINQPLLCNALSELRSKLMNEEVAEHNRSMNCADLEGLADDLVDIIYIALGTAATYGIDIETAFTTVHAANMAKLGSDGKPIRRSDGKCLKPDGWLPPNHKPMLAKRLEFMERQAEYVNQLKGDISPS